MNPVKPIIIIAALLMPIMAGAQKKVQLNSPDGKLKIEISVGDEIKYSVSHENDIILEPSQISMTLTGRQSLGIKSKLLKTEQLSKDAVIQSPIYKKSQIEDRYNEITLRFKEGFLLIFRAYDEGYAYRFSVTSKTPFTVESEQVEFNFPADKKTFASYVKKEGNYEAQFFNSFENEYSVHKISEWQKNKLAFLPVLFEAANNKKVCVTEANLVNYPGMYLVNNSANASVKGVFAPYVRESRQGGHNELQQLVVSRENFIAQYEAGTQNFPWRVAVISENDTELLDNDIAYKLADPCKLNDISWIKPGKVAWDWWNDWNIFGVDFESGINNETYKYYIDFASRNGIEYVILDEGWAVRGANDLLKIVPEIDLPQLADYAKSRNVGLILWAGYNAFENDMEKICKHYSEMGIKGFKVDFMDRDDQFMVDFHRRAAETTAQYKMLVDFHGTYKPTGLHRTYPNIINYEGVNGLEQMKWASPALDQVTYDVTMPFIRMLAGPIDYTQGAMRNATKGNYRPIYNEAMSQGTRCRQLAQYVIFESPLNMLCDNPSNYMREEECLKFIATVPTVWDKTIAIDGKVGEYIIIARQKGNDWYIGAMTNWDTRTLEIDLSFLGSGNFSAEIFRDGVNAHRVARDYKREVQQVSANQKIKIEMKPGGGWAACIKKR